MIFYLKNLFYKEFVCNFAPSLKISCKLRLQRYKK